jgi:predicted PurR-regulated permease PerM
VSLHPVAILLAVTTGAVVAGIIGAIVAVPVTAVVAQAGAYLRER